MPAVAIKLVASLAGDNDDRPVAVHRRRGGSLETDGRRVQRHERVTHGGHDGQGLCGSLRVGDGGGGQPAVRPSSGSVSACALWR